LVAQGHELTGLTRSAARRSTIETDRARAVVADALDSDRLTAVVRDVAPTHVVHLLTALPVAGPLRPRDLRATNVIRREGTRNLLRAAISAGARRLVAESFLSVYGAADFREPRREDEPFADAGNGPLRDTVLALRELEDQLRSSSECGSIETVALRLGGFYGPSVPSTDVAAITSTKPSSSARSKAPAAPRAS
jgi:nucleoside-diphosphate-sugar epimerase